MNLSSLGDTLRSRFNQLSVRLRPPAEMITQLREEAQAVQDSVKVSLKEQAERPTVYDRQAVVSSSPGRDTKLRALDKVAELKARVRMLKSRIAGASGPLLKRLARQLGQIAAELKQAVSLYTGASARGAGAGAGASDAGASLTGNANASATPSGAATSPAQTASGASAAGAEAGIAATVSAVDNATADHHADASPNTTPDSAARTDASAPAGQTDSSQAAHKEGDDKLDKLFAREVKTLLEEIKRAAALLRQKADKDSRNALSELDRVLADIQNMLAQLNQSAQSAAIGSTGAGSAVASVLAGAVSGVSTLGSIGSVDGGVGSAGAGAGVGDISVGSVAAAVSPGS